MDYPFLYSFAASVLQKLDQCNLNEFENPNDMKKDVEMLKGILNHLPSILETHDLNKTKTHDDDDDDDSDDSDADDEDHDDFGSSIISDIQKSVFGLHELLNEPLHPSFKSSWKDLIAPLTKFQDHKHPESSEKEENLLPSLSVALPEIESQDVKVNNLPLHLVPCLAYCALYPEDYRVVRETLINQWMAEGFLELQIPGSSSISGDLELEDIGNRYFMELLSMGVFVKPLFGFGGNSANRQAVTVYSCQIHPRMHRLARQITRKEVLVIDSHVITKYGDVYNDLYERVRGCTKYITLHGEEPLIRIDEALEARMRTCMFSYHEIRGNNVLKSIIYGPSESQISDLAEMLAGPRKLRCLAFFENIDWSNINWSSLQTLAVDDDDECVRFLEHMSHMRHLYYTSKETRWEVKESTVLEIHTSTLRILQLSYCSRLRSLSMSNIANFTVLKRLRIFECPRLVSLPDSIELLPRMEELVIHNCARLDLNYGRSMNSLPSLQYMELIGLPKLTELPAGLRSAKALLYLMIEDCKSLRSSDHTLQHLVNLQKLCVYDCPTFSITPNVFESLIALQSLDIRKCPNIAITSISDAVKDQAPFISHISEIILDGQQLIDRMTGLSREDAAAHGPETDSFSPRNFPHFILSLETFEIMKSSEGMLNQKYKLKVPSKWVVLALALKLIVNLRILHQQKLYCCLFPSDYEFERDTLFQLWMIKGFLLKYWKLFFNRLLKEEWIYKSRTDFLTGITKYKINVGKVTALSNRFKSKDHYTLIEDKDTKVDGSTSWHHDSVASKSIDEKVTKYKINVGKVTALSKSFKSTDHYTFIENENAKVDGSTSWHHVSVASKSIDEKVFQTLKGLCKLRSVLFIRDYGSSLKQIPSSFFTALLYMQVLDLSGSHISELPSYIGKMKDLHFLDLSYTPIERIPESIHFLSKLQTLKLKGCKHLHSLPEGMKGLVNLYYLDFDVLGQLTSMPKGFGALTELRTLSAFIVSKEDGCRIGELRNMNKLCGNLCISGLECVSPREEASEADMHKKSDLKRLHLKWSHSKKYDDQDQKQAVSFLFGLKALQFLTELQISNYPGSDFPTWTEVIKDIVSITLLNCEVKRLFHLEKLEYLKHLNIYGMNGVMDIDIRGSSNKVSFPELETLTIESMHCLRSFGWTMYKEVTDFPMLSKIRMRACPKLHGLPFLSHLPSLTYLEITDCTSFQSLPEGKLPASLETLIIDNCPELKKTLQIDKSSSTRGQDWYKIKDVPNIWIDMKDIHSDHNDTDSLSEDISIL